MGIPSYYRKLKDVVVGLVSKSGPSVVHTLCFDFNCLVYHVLSKTIPLRSDDDIERIQWENNLIGDVLKYVLKIVHIVKPTHEVFIGVDGVVPFAKMKQQRLRRFKGVAGGSLPPWDRNAITPGTYFMERLGVRLKTLSGAGGLKWILQDASLPGEGEQKLMEYLRGKDETRNIVIYGLDADLIVLSLILRQTRPQLDLWLFRETIEFGKMILDSIGEETYVYMNIQLLETYLKEQLGETAMYNYAMALCFLGNDFLPHGLSQKMSDEGHAVIMELLKDAPPLLTPDLSSWSSDGLHHFLSRLALTERADIERGLRKKLTHTPRITEDTSAEFYPATKVEYDFFEDGKFKTTWQRIYYENYVGASHTLAARTSAQHYFEGLHWIRAYYLGEACSNEWHYPFFLPPLWSDLLAHMDLVKDAQRIALDTTIPKPLPQEQLALVLPIESYWLIRSQSLRQLPYKAPQFWPMKYTLFSCGKKWMWECEAQIPLMTLRSLRNFIV